MIKHYIKMTKYQVSERGYISEHEDDDGFKSYPGSAFAFGAYAEVRRLIRPSSKQQLVVLKPSKAIEITNNRYLLYKEAVRKALFFRTLYPGKPVELYFFENHQTYRLILPWLPGISYKELLSRRWSHEEQIKIILSKAEALYKAHSAGLVIIDDNCNNSLFYQGTCYLIDGGVSQLIHTKLERALFHDNPGPKPIHVAPECWTFSPQKSAKATYAMDVFSLGESIELIEITNKTIAPILKTLKDQCFNEDPLLRPTISSIITQLKIALISFSFHSIIKHSYLPNTARAAEHLTQSITRFDRQIHDAQDQRNALGVFQRSICSALVSINPNMQEKSHECGWISAKVGISMASVLIAYLIGNYSILLIPTCVGGYMFFKNKRTASLVKKIDDLTNQVMALSF